MDEVNIETGRKIFESVPSQLVPIWAGQILYLFDSYISVVPKSIRELYDHINEPKGWQEAHTQFNAIRVFHLALPNFEPEHYIVLAEKVAKVIYNASRAPAPFDADSGWYIPNLAVAAAKELNSEELLGKLHQLFELFIDNPSLNRVKHLQKAKDILFELIDHQNNIVE